MHDSSTKYEGRQNVEFFVSNPLRKIEFDKREFNLVLSFNGLSHAFVDEASLREFFTNVTLNLKDNGLFAAFSLDSSELWHFSHKPKVNIGCASLICPKNGFEHYNSKVFVRIDSETSEHYIVHFPTLIK